ncbi:hypothetical protein AAC387_Pa07g0959 [Persea americana]
MGWVGGLAWVNYSKKHCRNLLWRLKAEMKKAVKNGSKQRATFGYDAWSYALNFDDGHCGFRNETDVLRTIQAPDPTSNTWVLVLSVKSL